MSQFFVAPSRKRSVTATSLLLCAAIPYPVQTSECIRDGNTDICAGWHDSFSAPRPSSTGMLHSDVNDVLVPVRTGPRTHKGDAGLLANIFASCSLRAGVKGALV